MATAFEVSIKSPTFPAGGGTSLFAGLGSDSAESQAAALAGLSRIQARTNHPSSSRKAAEELARLYDLFAHSAQPSALLTGRKKMMESALLPAFMGNGPRSRTINIIVQAFTGYWLGAPVTGGGLVTSFLGAPDLARELNAIWNSGSNSSAQIARRLARCFIVATRKVQYTIPPGVTGMMVVFPPLAI
jgi:hypothetical protein